MGDSGSSALVTLTSLNVGLPAPPPLDPPTEDGVAADQSRAVNGAVVWSGSASWPTTGPAPASEKLGSTLKFTAETASFTVSSAGLPPDAGAVCSTLVTIS